MPTLPGLNRISLTFFELTVFRKTRIRASLEQAVLLPSTQLWSHYNHCISPTPPECSTSHVLSFGWSNWKWIKFQRTMGALLSRCHGRMRTCLESGTVSRSNQNYSAYFSGCFRGAACLAHLDTFLLYFTYFIIKIFGRCYKKKQHDFLFPPTSF